MQQLDVDRGLRRIVQNRHCTHNPLYELQCVSVCVCVLVHDILNVQEIIDEFFHVYSDMSNW